MKKPSLIIISSLVLLASSMVTISAAYGIQTKTSHCTANQALPDSTCTPGAVLTTNISTICKSGYTKTVRDVSTSEKKQVFSEYGIPWSSRSNYEVDHLISLELGGSNDISNLWPESSVIKNGSLTKDKLENSLHAQICSDKMSIVEAQREISTNWLQYSGAAVAPKNNSQINQPISSTGTVKITQPIVTQPQIINQKPVGATAQCKDNLYSFSKTRSGTCSGHGGVKAWY